MIVISVWIGYSKMKKKPPLWPPSSAEELALGTENLTIKTIIRILRTSMGYYLASISSTSDW